jgi:hypothetical protein
MDNTTSTKNHVDSLMVSLFDSNAVDGGFELQTGQTKDYKISMCCFFPNHVTIRRNDVRFVLDQHT